MLNLEELGVYQLAMDLGDEVWFLIDKWSFFEKNTIGKQLVTSTDSIAANIAEGYGRFFYKENKQFCYYARGSLLEAKTWLTKAHKRTNLSADSYQEIIASMEKIHKKLNSYIRSIGKATDE